MSTKQHVNIPFRENFSESAIKTAGYIADLVVEMEQLARREGLGALAQSLEAARYEAARALRR